MYRRTTSAYPILVNHSLPHDFSSPYVFLRLFDGAISALFHEDSMVYRVAEYMLLNPTASCRPPGRRDPLSTPKAFPSLPVLRLLRKRCGDLALQRRSGEACCAAVRCADESVKNIFSCRPLVPPALGTARQKVSRRLATSYFFTLHGPRSVKR